MAHVRQEGIFGAIARLGFLLRASKLLFEPLAVRDVDARPDQPNGPALGVPDRHAAVQSPAQRAVLVDEPALDIDLARVPTQVSADGFEHALAIFEVHSILEELSGGARGRTLSLGFVAEGFPQVRPVDRRVFQLADAHIDIPDPHVRTAEGLLETVIGEL